METVEEVLQTVGNTIGIKDLTPSVLLKVAAIVLVGWLVIRLLMRMVDRMLDRSKSVASIRSYIHTAVHVFLWVLLALMLAGTLNVDVTSVIAMLSVVGLAVSLALQSTLSNLAGGLVLLVTKPFSVGDYVEADGVSGTIAKLDLAYTTFVTPDNKEIFIPNSQLSSAKIINYNVLGRRRMDVTFTASYDAPTAQVRAAIEEAPAPWAFGGRLWPPSPAFWTIPPRRSTCRSTSPAASSIWPGCGPSPGTTGTCTTPCWRGCGSPSPAAGWR